MNKIIELKDFGLKFEESGFEIGPKLNLNIYNGDFLGIVGESGCGKSTLGKILIGLINRHEIDTYNLNYFEGELNYFKDDFSQINLLDTSNKILRDYRKSVQMIFQNPRSTLNLKMTVIDTLIEAVQIGKPYLKMYRKNDKIKIFDIIYGIVIRTDIISNEVNRDSFLQKQIINKLNGNLSGGERRRVSIAKAMCVEPDVIVADEPLASLDASIKYNILNYFKKEWESRRETDNPLTIIIISHDFGAVVNTCNRFIVMFGNLIGKRANIIEEYNNTKMFNFKSDNNYHPYTKKLINSVNYFLTDDVEINNGIKEIKNQVEINTEGCVYATVCEKFENNCLEPSTLKVKNEKYHLNSCIIK